MSIIFPSSDVPGGLPYEVDPTPQERTVLLVLDGIAVFKEPGQREWTLEGIERVTRMRDPFGSQFKMTSSEYVIVLCPDADLAEFEATNRNFSEVWRTFARQRGIDLRAKIVTTLGAYHNRSLYNNDFDLVINRHLYNPGVTPNRGACLVFLTREFYQLVGKRKYWDYVLTKLLGLETAYPAAVASAIAIEPELVFGEGHVQGSGVHFYDSVTVIRRGEPNPQARVFRVKPRTIEGL